MKNVSPLIRVPARFGAIAGILGFIIALVLYYIGKHPFLFPVYFDFRVILFAIFIYFSLREYRDFYRDGVLYFWEGFIGSFIFVAVYAITVTICMAIFGTLQPEFLSTYISLSIEQLKSIPPDVIERIGKDVYQRNLEILPATTLNDMMQLYVVQSFIIGFFISIVLSVILRRQPKNQ